MSIFNYDTALEFCQRFADSSFSPSEHAEFLAWLRDSPEEEVQRLLDAYKELAVQPRSPTTADATLVAKIEALLDEEAVEQSKHTRYRTFIRYSAAAILLFALAGSGWWLSQQQTRPPAVANRPVNPVKNDIAPGGDKAVLTLADGSTVVLDGSNNGQIAQQGSASVTKSNGQITYASQGANAAVVYNTMTTPRGGQYRLVLADGTVAWLNSASSLRFPTAFPGAQREVELTGEGYFEVMPDKRKPFKVRTNDQTVEVLGTEFNIMAYPEESAIRTTLVSGSVRVEKGTISASLTPGKQAVLTPGAAAFQTQSADLEETIAWKNGRFEFDNTDIRTIMRQLERWYSIKVAYKGDVSSIVLSGSVSRRKTVAALLDILAETGRFHFSIEEDLITIRP